jgi:hypothetical protein
MVKQETGHHGSIYVGRYDVVPGVWGCRAGRDVVEIGTWGDGLAFAGFPVGRARDKKV